LATRIYATLRPATEMKSLSQGSLIKLAVVSNVLGRWLRELQCAISDMSVLATVSVQVDDHISSSVVIVAI